MGWYTNPDDGSPYWLEDTQEPTGDDEMYIWDGPSADEINHDPSPWAQGIAGNEGAYTAAAEMLSTADSGAVASIMRSLGLNNMGDAAKAIGNMFGNKTATLGITGITGAIAALTSKPKTSHNTGSSTQAGTSTTAQTSGQTGTSTATGTTSGAETTNQTVGGPAWYDAALKALSEKTGGTSPTTAYTGQLTSTAPDQWTTALESLRGGGQSILDKDLGKYVNPYMQNVLNPQLRRMDEDFALQQNKRGANAAMVGAFGGSRDILDRSLAEERFDKNRSETTNVALSQAYDDAMKTMNADRTADQWATGAAQSLGAANLGLDQANLTKLYDEFLRGDKAKTDWLTTQGNILGGMRPSQTTVGTVGKTGATNTVGTTGQTGTINQTGATTGTGNHTATSVGDDPNIWAKLNAVAGNIAGTPPISG